ncbi:hypothetical protein BDQ17DRAFT_1321283 [Cyathus striatus]|nr:hypothetical protein BDQ17DRAFT_1321283 [Cyathus striatus]
MLDPSPSPDSRMDQRQLQQQQHGESTGAPAPSSVAPSPLKKRRVTVSGAPHPLNTDVRPPVDQASSTPISPVVMGFTIQRDNPLAVEQVKSMITVKHKQKALIEQRRGSAAGIVSGSSSSAASAAAAQRSSRRSPNMGTGVRRPTNTQGSGPARPPSPNPAVGSSQQPIQVPTTATGAHSLPPPPISFARRRAAAFGGKKKPADIVISPRDAHAPDQFAPSIQSAPPVQSSFYTGRFPMALPRLPSAMGGGDNVRRVASNVPPTPTRLSMLASSSSSSTSQPIPGISTRSPPAASVPIAHNTRVPPTPSSLHHPNYSNDKSAFLAPFEMFYDALNDSKQLKNWLGEQLQRTNTLMQTLTQQQEKLNETVEALVDKKTASMRSEMTSLHRRVEELEDALRSATAGRRLSIDPRGEGMMSKGKQQLLRNGMPSGPVASESYTFPPVPPDPSRIRTESLRIEPSSSSSAWPQEKEHQTNHHATGSDRGSPTPFDTRRLSISATRLDPPRSHSHPSEVSSQPRGSMVLQSPPQTYRDNSNHPHSSTGVAHGKRGLERPSLSRQASYSNITSSERVDSPAPRRADGSSMATDTQGEES